MRPLLSAFHVGVVWVLLCAALPYLAFEPLAGWLQRHAALSYRDLAGLVIALVIVALLGRAGILALMRWSARRTAQDPATLDVAAALTGELGQEEPEQLALLQPRAAAHEIRADQGALAREGEYRRALQDIQAHLDAASQALDVLSGDVTLNGESALDDVQTHQEAARRRVGAALLISPSSPEDAPLGESAPQ